MSTNGPSQPLLLWSRAMLDEVIAVVRQLQGRDIAIYDESFLAKSLDKRRVAIGCETPSDYLTRLAQSREEAEAFLRSLNINYSAFFRNPLTFALLEQVILPALVDAKEKNGPSGIRIWSAGCATGQEAWSTAILLEELASVRECRISYRIIATDVADEALVLARQGIYNLTEVQNTPLKHVLKYFVAKGESYEIITPLRSGVDFSFYDLLDEHSSSPAASIYGDFDLVICSNLLFYYRPDIRQRILDKVCRALRHGGFFVTGEAERDIVAKQETLRAVMPLAAVFQKR